MTEEWLSQVLHNLHLKFYHSQREFIAKKWCPVNTSHSFDYVILKTATNKIITSTNMALKITRSNGYQNTSDWNPRKSEQICEVLETLIGTHWYNSVPLPGSLPLLPLAMSLLTTARNFWEGESPFALLFSVRREYFNLKWVHSFFFKQRTYLL
jgi:hypothetical protein